jgi:hypothetical protein
MSSGQCTVNGQPVDCNKAANDLKQGISTLMATAKCTQNGIEVPCSKIGDDIKAGVEKVGSAIVTGAIYTFIVFVLIFTFAIISSIGASKLAYQRSGSSIISIIAFFLSPLYYIYYGFTQPSIATV